MDNLAWEKQIKKLLPCSPSEAVSTASEEKMSTEDEHGRLMRLVVFVRANDVLEESGLPASSQL